MREKKKEEGDAAGEVSSSALIRHEKSSEILNLQRL